MKNKNLSEVLESVYKSLHLSPNPMIKVHTERLKFNRKPFLEGYSPRHINVSKKVKNSRYPDVINLEAVKITKNKTKNRLSFPQTSILRNFDILSPVQKQINEIEETKKSMSTKFKKAIHEIHSVCQSDGPAGNSELALYQKFRFPKDSPFSKPPNKKLKIKNPSLTVPPIQLKQRN